MNLAKPAIDVGLFVDGDSDAVLNHWSHTIGVPFDEMLPTGGGVRQHRHELGNSVIKINHSRDALDPLPSAGYRELLIADAKVASVTDVTDPAGNVVKLVPPGDVTQLRLRVATPNAAELLNFYREVLELEWVSNSVVSCGDSQIEVVSGPRPSPAPLRGQGFRYITIQVHDVIAEHRSILDRGGKEGAKPVRLGDVAYISFVKDPNDNWIEISQRKSLTGTLN
jgi:predicted enzyme related to lactoylglutathione lyase